MSPTLPDEKVGSELMELLKVLKTQHKSPEDKWSTIEKHFSIEKFSGKQKAVDWMENFEAECARHEITEDARKIKCLKLFVIDRAIDWYQSSTMKLPRDDWSNWVDSFVKVFSEKGWSKIRYAYGYKYFTGSIVEYALKKERLILEVESKTIPSSRINLIVLGLPIWIQEKLDREKITDTDDLINKLGQYDFGSKKMQLGETSDAKANEKKTFSKREFWKWKFAR